MSAFIVTGIGGLHSKFNVDQIMFVIVAFVVVAAVLSAPAVVLKLRQWHRERSQRIAGFTADPQSSATANQPAPVPHVEVNVEDTGVVIEWPNAAQIANVARECTICLGDYAEGDSVRVLSACKHGFHKDCIDSWMKSRLSCPLCRVDLSVGNQPRGEGGSNDYEVNNV